MSQGALGLIPMSSPNPGPLPVLGSQGEAGHQDVGDEGHGCRKQTDTVRGGKPLWHQAPKHLSQTRPGSVCVGG